MKNKTLEDTIENKTRKKGKRLRIENGSLEYCSGESNEYCMEKRIARKKIMRRTMQHNGPCLQ